MSPQPERIVLTRAQVRRLDALAIEQLGIPGVVLMENAGRGAAEELLAALSAGRLRPPRPVVLVLCGAGNNGGDGYVLARHLANAGLEVMLAETSPPERLSPDAAVFRRVVVALGLDRRALPDAAAWEHEREWLARAELVVDAVLGTGFRGELRPPLAGFLAAAGAFARAGSRQVVALDVPSGLDVDTGTTAPDALRADLTLTFAASKPGLELPAARAWTGELRVVSIGTPPELARLVQETCAEE